MADIAVTSWKYRLSTLGLLLAYSLSYTTPLFILRVQFGNAISLCTGWPLNAYTVATYVLTAAALFLAVLGPRVVKPGPLRVVRIFLVVNWLPHTVALLLAGLYALDSWID